MKTKGIHTAKWLLFLSLISYQQPLNARTCLARIIAFMKPSKPKNKTHATAQKPIEIHNPTLLAISELSGDEQSNLIIRFKNGSYIYPVVFRGVVKHQGQTTALYYYKGAYHTQELLVREDEHAAFSVASSIEALPLKASNVKSYQAAASPALSRLSMGTETRLGSHPHNRIYVHNEEHSLIDFIRDPNNSDESLLLIERNEKRRWIRTSDYAHGELQIPIRVRISEIAGLEKHPQLKPHIEKRDYSSFMLCNYQNQWMGVTHLELLGEETWVYLSDYRHGTNHRVALSEFSSKDFFTANAHLDNKPFLDLKTQHRSLTQHERTLQNSINGSKIQLEFKDKDYPRPIRIIGKLEDVLLVPPNDDFVAIVRDESNNLHEFPINDQITDLSNPAFDPPFEGWSEYAAARIWGTLKNEDKNLLLQMSHGSQLLTKDGRKIVVQNYLLKDKSRVQVKGFQVDKTAASASPFEESINLNDIDSILPAHLAPATSQSQSSQRAALVKELEKNISQRKRWSHNGLALKAFSMLANGEFLFLDLMGNPQIIPASKIDTLTPLNDNLTHLIGAFEAKGLEVSLLMRIRSRMSSKGQLELNVNGRETLITPLSLDLQALEGRNEILLNYKDEQDNIQSTIL